MAKSLLLATLLALAACSGMPQAQPSASACSVNLASYDCQVEMYSKAGM